MQDDPRSDAGAESLPSVTPRHVLRVPALSFGDYRRMQEVFVNGVAASRRDWRSNLTGTLGAVVVGGLGGVLVSLWEVSAGAWILSARTGWMLELGGLGVFLAAIGIVAATSVLLFLLLRLRQLRLMRSLYEAGRELFAGHVLLLGEEGILWRNNSRTLFVPWSRISGTARRNGMVFLLADRISAFWLPEAVIAAQPDPSGLEAFLRRHVPAF